MWYFYTKCEQKAINIVTNLMADLSLDFEIVHIFVILNKYVIVIFIIWIPFSEGTHIYILMFVTVFLWLILCLT